MRGPSCVCIGSLPTTSTVPQFSFTADGSALLVGGAPVTMWDLDPRSWAKIACTAAGRNLTRDEWNIYMPVDAAYRATCPQFPTPA